MPTGLMSGDWCRMGNLGQHFGLFDGGVAVMNGGKWAQVRAVGGQGADTLSLFGRRLNIHTDFGDIKFGSDSGKSFMEFMGGTDQTLESGVDRQNWTVKAAVGKGTGIANFAIMDRDGNTVYGTSIEADGTVTKIQSGDSADVFTGDQSVTYERAFSRTVLNGNDDITVANGDRNEGYRGNQTTLVSQTRSTSVLSDDSTIVGGQIYRSCKTQDVEVAGRLDALPGDSAATWKVSNGSIDIDVGKPPTDLQAALSSFNVTVWPTAGKVALKSMLGNVETFSGLETKMEALLAMNLKAGATFKAESIGLMELKTQAAMMAEATGVMQMKSGLGSMFGSSAITQLGGLSAVEPVVKGLTFLPALSLFLTACVSAAAVSAGGGGSVPSLNGAAIAAIGSGAGALLGTIPTCPSLKVMTE